jgi:hypothetical protein
MKNASEIKGLRAIPLPRIIWESTLDVPEGYSHVSHAVNSFQEKTVTEQAKGGKIVERTRQAPVREHVEDSGQPFLTSGNHGFYIGKFFPKPFRQRVMDLLGWSTAAKLNEEKRQKNAVDEDGEQTRIYSQELIEASLEYLYAHLREGEKVQYVIGRHLSEIINGREDVAEALSAEEEEKLVRKIARRKFGKKMAERLEIIRVEEMPLHGEIFAALREAADPNTGKCDCDQVLQSVDGEMGETPTSLQIAACLYRAAQDNHKLAMKFRAAVPGRLRNNTDDPEVKEKQNYAIIEVATRLADLLAGRLIQGGAKRQALYDDVIEQIVRGQKSDYANIREMAPLLRIFEGRRFETLHLDNQINPPLIRGIRNRARARLAMIGLLLGGAITGAYGLGESKGRQHQQEIQAKMDGLIAEKLKDTTFYFDYKWPLEKDKNVMAFHSVVEGVLVQIRDRYNLPAELVEELRPQMESFLLAPERGGVAFLNEEVPLRIYAADEFVAKNKLFFLSRGYDLGRPYAHLSPYMTYFDRCLEEKLEMKEYSYSGGNFSVPKKNLDIIGKVRSGGGYGHIDSYQLALYTAEDGSKHLVAADYDIRGERVKDDLAETVDPEYRPYVDETLVYSSRTAREMVCHYVREMKRYDAYQFREHDSLFHHLQYDTYFQNKENPFSLDEDFVVSEQEEWRLKKLGHYRDFAGAFDFELAVYEEYVTTEDGEVMKAQLVARQYDQKRFSTATAVLAAKHYNDAVETRYDGGSTCREW